MIVVFDLDGVLADHKHRLHYILERCPKDYDSFYQRCDIDPPIEDTVRLLKTYIDLGDQVEIWTGRPKKCREKTETWLGHQGILECLTKLRMREDGDYRNSSVLKKEWLDSCFPCERPDLVIEDSLDNIRMFLNAGIKCLQVFV